MGAPRSGGLRSIGQKLATLATHPNPSLEGRGYVLFPPFWAIPAFANEDRAGAVQASVMKLSITRLRPAVSKSISSLLPSIAAIVP